MTALFSLPGAPAAPMMAAPFQELLDRSPMGVIVHDEHDRLVHVNAAFARFLGYSQDEMNQLTADDIVHPDDRAGRDEMVADLIGGELHEAVADGRMLDRNGRAIWVRIFASAVTIGGDALIMICITDVDAWQDRVDRLQYAVTHDELTGVLNRSGLLAGAAELMSRGRAGRLALLDIDGLKTINDFYGHAAGDQVIQLTAELLAAEGAGEWLVGRLGGDEFAIVSPHADVELWVRIEAALARGTVVLPGVSLALSVSIGEAVLSPADELASTLRAADEQMYQRKRNGPRRSGVLPHQGAAGRSRLRERTAAGPPLGA